jgi:hypothetical protein
MATTPLYWPQSSLTQAMKLLSNTAGASPAKKSVECVGRGDAVVQRQSPFEEVNFGFPKVGDVFPCVGAANNGGKGDINNIFGQVQLSPFHSVLR